MHSVTIFRKNSIFLLLVATVFALSFVNFSYAQMQRNPVLEYCTGTWCGYCPQGHAIIQNTILPNIPNAIIIGYHGYVGSGDPFAVFPGNSILNSLGFSAYPTGIIDRVTGIQSRSAWYSYMNTRNGVPATVSITVNRSFDPATKQLNATFTFTALQNLTGQFKYNAILLESGMVYNQANGGANYVHRHVVRAMMNGALGEQLINGTWTQGQVITKTLSYFLPTPPPPSPDIIPDSCDIVAMVYKVGSPLNSNAEIQQAEEWTLIAPDYVATMAPLTPDIIASNTMPAHISAVLRNEGLMDDMYYIDLTFNGPAGWTQEFTTVNGTFPIGQSDSVVVASGDSTIIDVTVYPNSIDGYGASTLNFASKNNPGLAGSTVLRNVTTTGIDILVVDAEDDNYETYVTGSLDRIYPGTYGVVSRTALHPSGVDLSNFTVLTWSAGTTFPAFYPEEVNALEAFLNQGGGLFINGQDIGSDIFEPTGQSHFAQIFYHNYLHANYVADASNWFLLKGYPGDPITDGLQFVLGFIYDKSPEKIAPRDANATPILKYLNGPDIGAIKASGNNYRVVYLGIGLEQIDQADIRDTLMYRSLRWIGEGITSVGEPGTVAQSFRLVQNYPNPFNPSTTIDYVLNSAKPVETQLTIYNALGQKVRTLVNEIQPAGSHQVVWNGRDDFGREVASGIYYYKLVSGKQQAVNKMLLMR